MLVYAKVLIGINRKGSPRTCKVRMMTNVVKSVCGETIEEKNMPKLNKLNPMVTRYLIGTLLISLPTTGIRKMTNIAPGDKTNPANCAS